MENNKNITSKMSFYTMDRDMRDEIIELIHDKMNVYNAEIRADYTIINNKLDNITGHLTKLNGKVAKHEEKLIDLEISKNNHYNSCPHTPTIEQLKQDSSNKKYFQKTIFLILAVMASTATIMTLLINIFGG